MSRVSRRRFRAALLALLLLPAALPELAAQEAPPSRDAEILELDIKTSTLSELAAWCRSLGLSEGGDRAALGSRLRDHYKIAEAAAGNAAPEAGASQPKVITIESARSTEYFTLDAVDEDYARLRGDVVISLKDGDSVHRITAWELLYNRTRNLLSASGGVEYVKESGDTVETFRGESITVDLDNWSSIFMDGVSERSLSEGETAYRFAGNVISRSAEEATVLANAEISNAGNPEALWSLSASKIWLLPGSDFAILNGFLKVGEVPLLWIPAFFFPADEVVFHPVLGYRSREGTFVQTTTYILGRPQAESSTETSSISKILGNSSDMEKNRHGIFLRSTGKKSRDPNVTRLSVLLDAYTNLGAYVGTELALPKKGLFGDYKLSLGLGFTRDIYNFPSPNQSIYTPFLAPDYTESQWNSSRIGSLELPFRVRMTNAGSLAGKYGSFNWSLPFYSDPYVNRDFLNRTEAMDYVQMLKQGGSAAEDEDSLTKNVLGAYEWRLSGSPSISLPALSPYVSSLSVSNLFSFISFNYRDSPTAPAASPSHRFYFPEKFTIYSVSASISGTPLSIGGQTATAPPKAGAAADTENEPDPDPGDRDPFRRLGAPAAPWAAPKDDAASGGSGAPDALAPPSLSQRFDLPKSGALRFSAAYQLTPTSATELQFRSNSTNWEEEEDIDWSEVSSTLTSARTDGSVTFSLSDTNSLLATSLKFAGSGSWQGYGYINEEAEEYSTPSGEPDPDKINAAKVRALGQTSFTSSTEFSTTLKPFYQSPVWGGTNFQYSVKGLLAKSELKTNTKPDGSAIPNPSPDDTYWDILYGKWDKENLDSHRAAANVQASVMNKAQSLTIAAELPPRDSSITGDATLRAWVSETSLSGKIRDPFDDPKYDPLRLTETLRFNSSFTASQVVSYDPENDEFASMSSTLAFYGLTAAFTASYGSTYSLENDGSATTPKWVWHSSPAGEETFQPRDFRLGYKNTFKKDDLWDKRLSFSLGLDTGLAFDFQRFTSSNFTFKLDFTLGIAKFLDLTLGVSSANASIYRYFRDIPIFGIPDDLPEIGEKNIFKDLANSFRFDDERLRKESGFKLKSFHLALTHHLGDWNAKLDMTLSPYLDMDATPAPSYKFNNEVSFIVQWLPISEIKTEITHNKDKFEFK